MNRRAAITDKVLYWQESVRYWKEMSAHAPPGRYKQYLAFAEQMLKKELLSWLAR